METQNTSTIDNSGLWQDLEEKHQVPERGHLTHLSGLLNQELTRFSDAWKNLPVEARVELIQILIEIAESDWEMDFSAIFWLGLDDLNADVRIAAIDGLHESEDIRLVPRFRRMLLKDSDAGVRAAAAAGLAPFVLLGELGKILPRTFDNTIDALMQSYHNTEEAQDVHRRVIEALAYTGTAEVNEMIHKAYGDADLVMRTSAVFAMGRSGDDHWAPIIMQELHNTSPAMRYEAVRAAGELKLQRALTDIIDLTEDADIQVQQGALWALGQIGGRRASQVLEQFRNGADEAASDAATEALDELDFLQGDPDTFFGPPEEFSGEGEGWDDFDNDDQDDDMDGLTIQDEEEIF